MHRLPDAMAAHFTHHTVAATLTVGLHRIADVADTLVSHTCSRNAFVKRLLSGGQQLHHRLVHFPTGKV